MTKRIGLIIAIFCFLHITLLDVVAYAQDLPPSSRPEVERRSAIEDSKVPTERKKEETPLVEEMPKAKVQDSEKKVKIDKITVEGNVLISEKEIREILSPYEGRELTLSEMNESADKITMAYRRKGYITSFAYLPPQKISGGLLKISVIEGKIGKVSVEGEKYFRAPLIKWQFKSKSGDTIKYNELLWGLEKLNKNPDRLVQSVLLPSKEQGKTDVVLKVKENFPVHMLTVVNNKGTATTGRQRYGLNFLSNNFLGLDDTAQAFFQGGSDAFSMYLAEELPVTNFGTNLGFSYSAGKVWPGKNLKVYDIIGNSKTYSLYLRQDFQKSQHTETSIRTGFDYISSDTKVLGSMFNKDNYRVLKNGFNVKFSDPWGYNIVDSELKLGLGDLWGGNERTNWDSSRRGTGGTFCLGAFSFFRTNPLPLTTLFNVSVNGQITDSRLASPEQFYMGGEGSVRGYPQSEVGCDNGMVTNLEFIVPVFFFGNAKMPFAKTERIKDQFSMHAFYDLGIGSLRAPTVGEDSYSELMSFGAGIRYKIRKNLYASVELGVPVSQRPSDNRDYRVHFSVRTELF